ncbi:MAG: IS1595 family transposase [Solirubrobacterales bacterium]
MTYSRFLERFPDNAACLDYLKNRFHPDGSDCPSCGKATKFHRLRGRAAYSCQFCGHQVYPTAGTIFHRSTTSLQLWFWAIYLMSSTRCGISAKHLEREIGVTYKTAHRMFKLIRTLLSDEGDGPLSGDVEADETFHGGKPRAHANKTRKDAAIRKYQVKAQVFGMVEREGRVRAWVVQDRTKPTLHAKIREHVLPAAMIFTDDYRPYVGVERNFQGHRRINHSQGVYVEGDNHTQTIEGFFGLFKNGVRGVYHSVSARYLQNYLDEYSFRYNRRHSNRPLFWAILDRVSKPQISAA